MSSLVLLLAGICSTGIAAEPPALKHNPFSRPSTTIVALSSAPVLADGTVQPLDLRATMVGRNGGLANVAGRVMRPGDEMQGYRLVRVLEDRAIFARDGKQATLFVKPERNDDGARNRTGSDE